MSTCVNLPPVKNLTLARIRCFATFGRTGGGATRPPPLGVSKRSVVELRGKDEQIALAEYSRLVVLFLVLGQYPVMAGQRSNFRKFFHFLTL